jgi:hypothetical protein
MAKRETDIERAIEPRDSDPSVGADDRVEQLRGTADDESGDFDDGEDDDMEDEDEADEGTF